MSRHIYFEPEGVRVKYAVYITSDEWYTVFILCYIVKNEVFLPG